MVEYRWRLRSKITQDEIYYKKKKRAGMTRKSFSLSGSCIVILAQPRIGSSHVRHDSVQLIHLSVIQLIDMLLMWSSHVEFDNNTPNRTKKQIQTWRLNIFVCVCVFCALPLMWWTWCRALHAAHTGPWGPLSDWPLTPSSLFWGGKKPSIKYTFTYLAAVYTVSLDVSWYFRKSLTMISLIQSQSVQTCTYINK